MNERTSPDIITVDQCAELLHCTAQHVEELALAGEIPGLKIGGNWIFVYPDVLHFLAEKARAEAEVRRMKCSSRAPAPQARPRRQTPSFLPVPAVAIPQSGRADVKPPASTPSDKDQVIEEYFHAGMKIEICRDAGTARRPTYYAVVINPNAKTRSGTPVDANSYVELRAAVEAHAERKARLWRQKQERGAGQAGPSQ